MRASLLHPLIAWRHHEIPPAGRRTANTAVKRTRDAGGPLDEACYPCSCGYFFIAPVSTTVSCPHCGATQAW
jgi:hypothetical protein